MSRRSSGLQPSCRTRVVEAPVGATPGAFGQRSAAVAVVLRDALRFKPAVGSVPYRWRQRDQSGYGAVSANRYLERGRRTPRCPSRDREFLPQRVQWRRRRRGRAVGPLGQLGSPSRYTSRRFRVYCRPAQGNATTGNVCRRCGELARCRRLAVRAKLLLLQVITPICVAIRALTGGIPLDSCAITQMTTRGYEVLYARFASVI